MERKWREKIPVPLGSKLKGEEAFLPVALVVYHFFTKSNDDDVGGICFQAEDWRETH